MACKEFTDAINWSKQSSLHKSYPVVAYFTKHFASATDTVPSGKDAVHYASGPVTVVDLPASHLKGTLAASINTEVAGEMAPNPRITYDVEVYPDGKLTYLERLDGKPIGGIPTPTTVQAMCVANHLLTATTGSEVVAIGVARKPPEDVIT